MTLAPATGDNAGAPAAEPLLFERSRPERRASTLRATGIDRTGAADRLPAALRTSTTPALPELAERDLVSHYTRLAHRNFSIDEGFYPLGSCSMKYNPKIAEVVAGLPGFARLHPAQPAEQTQGVLELLWSLEQGLAALTGMAAVTFQPAAGASGELTGLMVIAAAHGAAGDRRKRVIIPDAAHGTNPASVRLAGYEVAEVPSDVNGLVDLSALEKLLDTDVAALMLTNPNTLGLFERNIDEIARLLHDVGAKLYYDGANFNAILGRVRPGDMGFDVVHMNLHKTFATPHGGGGPGSGPVAVTEELARYLPGPRPARLADGSFGWHTDQESIGRVHGWHGNVGIDVRAYSYFLGLGGDGLRRVSERAVLNANYLLAALQADYDLPYPGPVMHEFVLSARRQKRASGVRALDIAKALIDRRIHPMTVYFPLIVDEAMMIEPTETESRETLDEFVAVMAELARLAENDPASLKEAPVTAPVRRLDETRAARQLVARWVPPAP
ncbi:MAG: aminomethyl-transferring glycine dehydrogenase subunit GcvPB [Actinomycetota bacterium]|nr:aminomethyl-transferring glycine dehydrogenase subunit GcvPB [Actinomycetota bacterium]